MGIHFLSKIARKISVIKLSGFVEIFTFSTPAHMVSVLHPMESISLNSFVLLEHLAMLLTLTLAINC